MRKEVRHFINYLAERVIEFYNIEIPIENIEDIVQKIGGRIVEKAEFNDLSDGSIKKIGENEFEIAISKYQSKKRKNFTIAHELGHLFLHMGYMTNEKIWKSQDETVYKRYGTSTQEYQANEFAAALLMPREEYKEVIESNVINNTVIIANVARYFNVSVEAAINRGRFLGYLE